MGTRYGLACPRCGATDNRMTRQGTGRDATGEFIRRLRVCGACGCGYYTRETIESLHVPNVRRSLGDGGLTTTPAEERR